MKLVSVLRGGKQGLGYQVGECVRGGNVGECGALFNLYNCEWGKVKTMVNVCPMTSFSLWFKITM